MKRLFVILFALLMIIAAPAMAQVKGALPQSNANDAPSLAWFKVGPADSTALLVAPESLPKTLPDFANVFYGNCVNSNDDPSMKPYVVNQCACAAAKLPGALDIEQARRLFGLVANVKIDFLYTRFMMLAYLPCMEASMHDIVLDDCITNPVNKRIKHQKAVCECIANGASDYVSKHGQYMLPGLTVLGLDPKKAVDNPLVTALKYKGFQIDQGYQSATCAQRLSLGWSE